MLFRDSDCKEESTSSSMDKQRLSAVAGAAVSIVEDNVLCMSSQHSTSLVGDEIGLTDNTLAGSFTRGAGESLGVEEVAGLLTDAFFTVKKSNSTCK